jgi:hypothetical protein
MAALLCRVKSEGAKLGRRECRSGTPTHAANQRAGCGPSQLEPAGPAARKQPAQVSGRQPRTGHVSSSSYAICSARPSLSIAAARLLAKCTSNPGPRAAHLASLFRRLSLLSAVRRPSAVSKRLAMSGSGVGVAHRSSAAEILTPLSGEGGRLPHAPVAGVDEDQVEGCSDRP